MDYLRDMEEHFDAMRKSMNGLLRWAHEQRVEKLSSEAKVEWYLDLLTEVSVIGGTEVRARIEEEVAKMTGEDQTRYNRARASHLEKHS